MIYSEHDGSKISIVVKGRTIKKPEAILDYNEGTFSIDRLDQLGAYYLFQRKTLRWSAKLGIHMLRTIMNNNYLLFTEKCGNKLIILQF